MILLKLSKFLFTFTLMSTVLLATVTGGAHAVGEIDKLGKLPKEGKAAEIAGFLVKWDHVAKDVMAKASELMMPEDAS